MRGASVGDEARAGGLVCVRRERDLDPRRLATVIDETAEIIIVGGFRRGDRLEGGRRDHGLRPGRGARGRRGRRARRRLGGDRRRRVRLGDGRRRGRGRGRGLVAAREKYADCTDRDTRRDARGYDEARCSRRHPRGELDGGWDRRRGMLRDRDRRDGRRQRRQHRHRRNPNGEALREREDRLRTLRRVTCDAGVDDIAQQVRHAGEEGGLVERGGRGSRWSPGRPRTASSRRAYRREGRRSPTHPSARRDHDPTARAPAR